MAVLDSWHDYRPLLSATVAELDFNGFASLLSRALNKPNVVRRSHRLYELNSAGVAYSAMNQTDMGTVLLGAARTFDKAEFLQLGLECLNVVVDRMQRGGLRSNDGNWLHSKTGLEPTPLGGGTLNQHLISARNLADASIALADMGVDGDVFADVARKAVIQLAAGPFPGLRNFIVTSHGKPALRSWLYYGVTFKEKKGYFLERGPKNGNYSVLSLSLLYRLSHLIDVDWTPFARTEVGNVSILRFLLRSYLWKVGEGLFRSSVPVAGGDWSGLNPRITSPLPPDALAWMRSFPA